MLRQMKLSALQTEGRIDIVNIHANGELYAIYILRECQGRGIGTRLFHALAEQLFQSGLSSMIVWVLGNNPTAAFMNAWEAAL